MKVVKLEDCINEIKSLDNNGIITRSVNHICEDMRAEVKEFDAIPVPEGATNGDMIKAMLQVVGYTPLSTWAEKKKKKGFHVHIQGEFKTDFRLTVSEDWWNAPYREV